MQFTTTALALLGAISLASAAPAKRADLKPWEVSLLTTLTNGYNLPGSEIPNDSFRLNISDPNVIPVQGGPPTTRPYPASRATCEITWKEGDQPPWNRNFACDADEDAAKWSIALFAGEGNTTDVLTNFRLGITLVDTVDGISKTFTSDLLVDGSVVQVVCGASGVCRTGLRTDPLAVQQTALA